MTALSSDQTRPAALTREAADTLAAQLVGDMITRWRQGERRFPEDYLGLHPELWAHPEAAVDLIYEELCLRQEYGPQVPVEQVLQRFPQWRPQLEVLFDCQRLLGPREAGPRFPAVGEVVGDFLLLAELGRGGQGRVFLASQLTLGDRPVVLKLTPFEACEHLSLARLQHTHIVPLYSVQDYSTRGLRALCMPYFGGATLAQLLETRNSQLPEQQTGLDLLNALDRAAGELQIANCKLQIDNWSQSETCPRVPREPRTTQSVVCNLQFAVCNPPSPARRLLAQSSYEQAVCWISACLADALQYAHERGLVHLDLKPSNVLLAADGQPMLLDFHLAREPVHPEGGVPQRLGGTAGYMSPEQQAALLALQRGRTPPMPVDGRSDIYSLGVVLSEALGETLLEPGPKTPSETTVNGGKASSHLPRSPDAGSADCRLPIADCRLTRNPHVSVGLGDVISKCLAVDPDDRYSDMAALAADLRRHLADLPLSGVRNRSLPERWRKWRRRRPHGLALAGMMLAVFLAASAVGLGAASHFSQLIEQARTALSDGQTQMARGQCEAAISTLERGLAVARGTPFQQGLAGALDLQLRLAEHGRAIAKRTAAANELHRLADHLRFLYGSEHISPEVLRRLEARCRAVWENRQRIVDQLSRDSDAIVRDDLLDLAIIWADVQVRLAPPTRQDGARRRALTLLDQAEALFGSNPVLDEELKFHGGLEWQARIRSDRLSAVGHPTERTAWEHYSLSRAFLRSGNVDRAAEEAAGAVALEPQRLWPNFYQGLCAYRQGRYGNAATAFSVCIGAAPKAATCIYNRALAFQALGDEEQALHDYDHTLRLDPTLAAAALNRGMLHYRAKRYDSAQAGLSLARDLGADPATVSFDLALVHLARGDPDTARENLRQALRHNPHQADARQLYDKLQDREGQHDRYSSTTAHERR